MRPYPPAPIAGGVYAQTYPNMMAALKGERANVIQLLIRGAGYESGFSSANTALTFFVPTDTAMFKTAKGTPLGNPAVLSNKRLLQLILKYHAIPSASIKAGTLKTNLPGYSINVSKPG